MHSPSQLGTFGLWVQILMTATQQHLVWKLLQSECVFVSFGFSLSDLHHKVTHTYECVTHQLLSCSLKEHTRPTRERPNKKTRSQAEAQIQTNDREGNSTTSSFTLMVYSALFKVSGLALGGWMRCRVEGVGSEEGQCWVDGQIKIRLVLSNVSLLVYGLHRQEKPKFYQIYRRIIIIIII